MKPFITRRKFLSFSTTFIISITEFYRSAEVFAGIQKVQIPETTREGNNCIQDRVKKIIVEQLGVSGTIVVPKASIVDDLGADSLDLVELVMAIEEEFNFEIPDEDAEKLITVQDFINFTSKILAKTHSQCESIEHKQLYLRDARLSDVDQLAEITFHSWQEVNARILEPKILQIGTLDFFRERWNNLLQELSKEASCLVLTHEHRIVAVGASGPYRIDSSPPDEKVRQLLHQSRYGEFFRGYLETNRTMRKKSEMLFVACANRLLEHGFEKAGLWTSSENTRMRRFAESMGGTYVTKRPTTVFGRIIPNQQEVFYSFDLRYPVENKLSQKNSKTVSSFSTKHFITKK